MNNFSIAGFLHSFMEVGQLYYYIIVFLIGILISTLVAVMIHNRKTGRLSNTYKELDRLKSQFISTITHELRTPIVATQKSLEGLMDEKVGSLTSEQLKFIGIAKRNLDILGHLINDILDYSKLEAGKMKLELAETNVEEVVRQACEGLSSWALSKQIAVECRFDDKLPKTLLDSRRIIQVLNNLIGNALKFTPKGGRVTVEAGLINSATEIQVSVIDTGAGIATEELGRVFERFHQAGNQKQSDISGTGLGLFIAKEIVELHGGRIWAESEKGSGAKFIFVLPINGKKS